MVDPFSRDGRFPEGGPPCTASTLPTPNGSGSHRSSRIATTRARQAGHPWKEHRPLVNGILWHLHTGAPWPDTPERYGPWQTVYDRFNRWRKDGMWAKILDALLLRLDKAGLIDRDLWLVDASVIRAHQAAAGAEKKSSRAPGVSGAGRVARVRAAG